MINKNIQCGNLNNNKTEVMHGAKATKLPCCHCLSLNKEYRGKAKYPHLCIQIETRIQYIKATSSVAALSLSPLYPWLCI